MVIDPAKAYLPIVEVMSVASEYLNEKIRNLAQHRSTNDIEKAPILLAPVNAGKLSTILKYQKK